MAILAGVVAGVVAFISTVLLMRWFRQSEVKDSTRSRFIASWPRPVRLHGYYFDERKRRESCLILPLGEATCDRAMTPRDSGSNLST